MTENTNKTTVSVFGKNYNINYKGKFNKKQNKTYYTYSTTITLGQDPKDGSQLQHEITAPTLEGCIAKLKEELGDFQTKQQEAHKATTVKQWFEYTKELIRPASENTTMLAVQGCANKLINPLIGNIKLTELNEKHISDLLKHIKNAGYSTTRAFHTHNFLKKSLQVAVDSRIIPYNPCLDVMAPKIIHKEKQPLWKDEIPIFMELAKNGPYYNLLAVMMATGLRVAEAVALHWYDIDTNHNTIFIHSQAEQYGKNRRIKPYTKSKKDRTIPFSDGLYEYLNNQKEKQKAQNTNPNNLVFTESDGSQIPINKIYKEVKKIGAAMNRPDISTHTLRHTCLTHLYCSSKDIFIVQKQGGHSHASTAADYIHFSDEISIPAVKASQQMLEIMHRRICS